MEYPKNMVVAKSQKRFTPQEYYALERDAAYKSDYYNGQIIAMSGGTANHNRIIVNVLSELHRRLKGARCTVYDSNLRVNIQPSGLRTYPDVSVYCEEIDYDEEDPDKTTAMNPTVIVEVLSRNTEGYDRGFKFENYRLASSIQAFVMVSQWHPRVDTYERQLDGSWLLRYATSLDSTIAIPGIKIDLPLAEIYDGVTFAERPPLRIQ